MLKVFALLLPLFVGLLLAYISGVKSQIVFIIKNIYQTITFDSLVGNKCEHPWPQMEEIADLDFVKINKTNGNGTVTTRIFKYTALPNAPIYWPGEVPLDQVKDVPLCGFDGQCPEEDSNKGRLNICNKPIKFLEKATSLKVLFEDLY